MAIGRKSTKEYNYFEKMAELADISKQAAIKLVDFFNDFEDLDETEIQERAEEIHDIEHKGDKALHAVMHELNHTFITPIDREDIIEIVNQIDDVTDAIEDVANHLYMLSVKELHIDTYKMGSYILEATSALYDAVVEFEKYKVSKNLQDLIIRVNRIEAEGDTLYRTFIKELFSEHSENPIYIIKWKEIFDYMENILDGCEDAATTIEGITIKNS